MTACIVGWAHTPFGKLSDETVESLVVRVAGQALADAGIAAKDAENADSLVRSDGSALPLDRVAGASDRGREADAVLGVADVVVHRLRNGDDFDAEFVELGRVTERVVAADGDQVFDAQA